MSEVRGKVNVHLKAVEKENVTYPLILRAFLECQECYVSYGCLTGWQQLKDGPDIMNDILFHILKNVQVYHSHVFTYIFYITEPYPSIVL